jgi:hypothetical protein
MSKARTLLSIVIVVLITIAASFISGIFWQKNASDIKVTRVDSTIILDKITNEAFLITKSVYVNQESVIKVDQGSDWSNFWWGQTITTQGLMRVNVGVDLKQLKSEQIAVDQTNKVITITLGKAEVLNVTVDGGIRVKNQAGILKSIFDNDSNKDYNTAFAQLTKDAKAAVEANNSVMDDARTDSVKLLRLILRDTGYDVKVELPKQ